MGEKANAILNLRSVFSKGRGIQAPLDQTLGKLHLKGKNFKTSKILSRTEDLIQLKVSTDPRRRVQTRYKLKEGGDPKSAPNHQSKEMLAYPCVRKAVMEHPTARNRAGSVPLTWSPAITGDDSQTGALTLL